MHVLIRVVVFIALLFPSIASAQGAAKYFATSGSGSGPFTFNICRLRVEDPPASGKFVWKEDQPCNQVGAQARITSMSIATAGTAGIIVMYDNTGGGASLLAFEMGASDSVDVNTPFLLTDGMVWDRAVTATIVIRYNHYPD